MMKSLWLNIEFMRTTESRVRKPAKSMNITFSGTPAATRARFISLGSL